MFNKELKKEIADLRLELKGFYRNENGTSNQDNEFLKQLYSLGVREVIPFADYMTEDLVKLYSDTSQVRGIIDKIATAVSELSGYVELQDKNKKVIDDHWASKILNKPNDRFSKTKFFKAWTINRLLTGEAFVYFKMGVGKDIMRFSEMYVMPSQIVDVISDSYFAPISKYKLSTSPSLDSALTPDNVMYSFAYNTDANSIRGLSPLKSSRFDTQLLKSALNRQNTSLTQGGVTNVVTPKSDNMGGSALIDSKTLDKELNSGKRVNGTLPLTKAVEVHRLGDNPADLGVSQTMKDAVTALCFVFNVPVDLYLGQAKYENTKEAKKAIYEQVAIPLMQEFLEDFNNFLSAKMEEKFILNTDKIEVLQDQDQTLTVLAKMKSTLNEMREYMGYPRIEKSWADEPIFSMGDSIGMVEDINENV